MHLPFALVGLGGAEFLIVLMAILFLFAVPLWIVPSILAYVILDRIPPQDRRQDPAMALLLLIPFFSLIWSFFVYPRISESLESYFQRRGDRSVGDCGKSLALVICICELIPFVHLVAVVAMIVFFVQAFTLTDRIRKEALPPAAPLGQTGLT